MNEVSSYCYCYFINYTHEKEERIFRAFSKHKVSKCNKFFVLVSRETRYLLQTLSRNRTVLQRYSPWFAWILTVSFCLFFGVLCFSVVREMKRPNQISCCSFQFQVKDYDVIIISKILQENPPGGDFRTCWSTFKSSEWFDMASHSAI